MTRFQRSDSSRTPRTSGIHVRLTVDEAVLVMRAIAAQQWRELDADKRDDLEVVRLKLYDRMRPGPAEVITLKRCA